MAASVLQSLESTLNDFFVKKAPPLPDNSKKALVKYLPWINLALGILTLYSAKLLWNWAHEVNKLVDYANRLNALYGGSASVADRMSFGVWFGLAVLIAGAIIYIAAFPGARDRKKSGWNLMFYALLLNVVYGVVTFFTDYGSFANLLGAIIGSGIGLYLLFQIRASYSAKGVAASRKPKSTKA